MQEMGIKTLFYDPFLFSCMTFYSKRNFNTIASRIFTRSQTKCFGQSNKKNMLAWGWQCIEFEFRLAQSVQWHLSRNKFIAYDETLCVSACVYQIYDNQLIFFETTTYASFSVTILYPLHTLNPLKYGKILFLYNIKV